MKRYWLAACVVACAAALEPSYVHGQENVSRWAPRFDIGVYAGGAYTSEWYESRQVSSTGGVITGDDADGEGYGIGITPAFGGVLNAYMTPMLGLRLHYGYMPSAAPRADDGDAEDDRSENVLNNHLYDLSLVLRPWAGRSGGMLGQSYLFIGGGGFTADVASGEGPNDESQGCFAPLLPQGACLPHDVENATVAQGTAGIGFDVFSITNNIGAFFELAGHVYDSPVHVGNGFIPPMNVRPGQQVGVADDLYAITGRAVLGLKLGFGGFGAPAMTIAPMPPPPPPAMAPPPPPPPPPAPAMSAVNVCVVEGGALRTVQAMYNPATGDTLVNNRRFSEVYPAAGSAYASGQPWFVADQSVTVNGREYVRFGLARTISASQLMNAGMTQGISVFADAGTTGAARIIYVPVRPGCEFQPYQLREQIRVRG